MNPFLRYFLIFLSLLILATVFLFQNYPYAQAMGKLVNAEFGDTTSFIINKTIRVLLNDNAAILLIYALFLKKEYVKLAFGVQLIEVLILLPLYFIFKLSLEGTSEISSPLLAQFHRLIVNPTLMILLIFGFLYQKYRS